MASIATYKFYRAGFFSWPLLWPFLVTSVPFAYLDGRMVLLGNVYRPLVGAVLLFAAYRLLMLSRRRNELEPSRGAPLPPALAWGAIIGLLSGVTGVGAASSFRLCCS